LIAPIAHQFFGFAIAYPRKLALIAYQSVSMGDHPRSAPLPVNFLLTKTINFIKKLGIAK
jgi:hypothetical protein